MPENIKIIKMGVVPYAGALQRMKECHANVLQSGNGVILVVEHPPVVTMGNRLLQQDMRVSEESLRASGIDFAHIDRGGSVTVHELGQSVVYPILPVSASRLTVRRFVWCLEESMIIVAKAHGVIASRDEINPGIWVGNNKLGAIGIRVANRVSKHGLAFNVNNSLATFRYIVPCGLQERWVTTLSDEMRKAKSAVPINSLEVASIGEQIANEIVLLVNC
jgi:lipoate-protein ligase B